MAIFSTRRATAQKLVLITAGLLFGGLIVRAQNSAGTISGVVEDAQGAVVPNAKVTLTNSAQGAVARDVLTSPEGTFVFTPVLAGTYQLTVEAPGFKKYVQSGLKLDVNDKLGLP